MLDGRRRLRACSLGDLASARGLRRPPIGITPKKATERDTLAGGTRVGRTRSMGIDVQLRSESGEILGEVSDADRIISRASSRAFSGTRLLKYLVPWGDAVFNQAQAGDLADDIRELLRSHAGTPLGDRLGDVQPLVDRLAAGTHEYLWFVGD